MTKSDSVLAKLCTENVYMDNMFHILGVGIDVTPRKLRRRREDIDSAHELGEEAWRNQFKHLLGNCAIPTYQEVCDAFSRIENPEERIVSEFFWFWPTGDGDSSLEDLLAGRKPNAIKAWERGEYAYGKSRIISIHNLAVVYHLYAIDAELQSIAYGGNVPDDYRSKMCSYWDKSFSYWEQLADNDDFWDLFAERVRQFDDPRLAGGFVRRFRQEFPIAFDNINAKLAVEYAKLDVYADAKRHADYMLKTMSGLDDVQSMLNVLFDPMEQKVNRLIDNYDIKARESPSDGLKLADNLLKETEGIRRIAEALLKKGQRIRTVIVTKIVAACNRYQVWYGNKTDDWDGCLRILEFIRPMACTADSESLINKNLTTVRDNIRRDEEENVCLRCKKHKRDCSQFAPQTVKLYGNVQKDPSRQGRVTFSIRKIMVPRCKDCKRLSNDEVSKYTPISRLLKEGFKIGDGPSDAEICDLWGMPRPTYYGCSSFVEGTDWKELGKYAIRMTLWGIGIAIVILIIGLALQ